MHARVCLSFTQQTIEAWRIVFLIGSASFIICNLIFVIFGSSDIQPWNALEPSNEEEAVEENKNN